MTLLLQHYLVVTALGTDRLGIMNIITRHVNSRGYNIEDSRLAILGEEFTFIMLLSDLWNAVTLIKPTLPLKGAELDLLVMMKYTMACPRPPTPAPVWVQVDVTGSPHLIECFTALSDAHHTNIAELILRIQSAENEGTTQLYTQITARGPASADTANTGQAFGALCTRSNTQGSVNTANYSQHGERDGVK